MSAIEVVGCEKETTKQQGGVKSDSDYLVVVSDFH